MNLYPLKFTPIIKDKIWEEKLNTVLDKPTDGSLQAGRILGNIRVDGDISRFLQMDI